MTIIIYNPLKILPTRIKTKLFRNTMELLCIILQMILFSESYRKLVKNPHFELYYPHRATNYDIRITNL